ncbi:hypothetical protein NUACC21_80430 [Scytonema sp. NUACC21]
MRLTYRGLPYTSSSQTVETIASDISARFLGQVYQIRLPADPYVPQPATSLRFRGSLYFKV